MKTYLFPVLLSLVTSSAWAGKPIDNLPEALSTAERQGKLIFAYIFDDF